MPNDEISAFKLAIEAARQRGLPWHAPFYLYVEGETWVVDAGTETMVSVAMAANTITIELPQTA